MAQVFYTPFVPVGPTLQEAVDGPERLVDIFAVPRLASACWLQVVGGGTAPLYYRLDGELAWTPGTSPALELFPGMPPLVLTNLEQLEGAVLGSATGAIQLAAQFMKPYTGTPC